MESNFSAMLWKIGVSVVFTIPSKTIRDFGLNKKLNFVLASIQAGDKSFDIMMKPWKCGGSYVFTIPSPYVAGFSLIKYVKNKKTVDVKLKQI
jgi:hypothetical protein